MKVDFKDLKNSNVEIITLGLRCLHCGKTWGINLHGKELSELSIGRFICEDCHKIDDLKK